MGCVYDLPGFMDRGLILGDPGSLFCVLAMLFPPCMASSYRPYSHEYIRMGSSVLQLICVLDQCSDLWPSCCSKSTNPILMGKGFVVTARALQVGEHCLTTSGSMKDSHCYSIFSFPISYCSTEWHLPFLPPLPVE